LIESSVQMKTYQRRLENSIIQAIRLILRSIIFDFPTSKSVSAITYELSSIPHFLHFSFPGSLRRLCYFSYLRDCNGAVLPDYIDNLIRQTAIYPAIWRFRSLTSSSIMAIGSALKNTLSPCPRSLYSGRLAPSSRQELQMVSMP
jgi:hypothetical protein